MTILLHKMLGFCVNCGYLLILYAYTFGEVSYIVAAREVSVVLGSLLGAYLLSEVMTKPKMLGICLITLGLIMLKAA